MSSLILFTSMNIERTTRREYLEKSLRRDQRRDLRRDCDSIIKDLETENSVAKYGLNVLFLEKVNFPVSKLNNRNLGTSKSV